MTTTSSDNEASCESLWRRFPAADQYLRHKLMEEIFPVELALTRLVAQTEPERWRVLLRWPEIEFEASEEFSSDELRAVIGRWSTWARRRALDIANELPV